MKYLTLQSAIKFNVAGTCRAVVLLRLGLAALFTMLWCGTPLWGQSACTAVAQRTLCLDQPQSGDTKISGQADKGTVDIKVDNFVYRKVRVINHKFEKNLPALGADLTVMATYTGAEFPAAGLK